MGLRDDFSAEVKHILAGRVGLRCANPECQAGTAGPQSDPAKVVNIGVAAHITAASPGGPRFDSTLSAEERSSATNGIWLCQNCAKRIDNDASRYSVELIRAWKVVAESRADAALGKSSAAATPVASPTTPKEHAIAAIAANASNADGAVRNFMTALSQQLVPLASRLHTQSKPTVEEFSAGIDAAKPLVQEFCEVASAVAEFKTSLAPRLFKGFEGILEQYDSSTPGSRWSTSFDIAKFVGHELFLVFVASMIRFEEWMGLADAFGETLFAYSHGERRPLTYSNILCTDIVLAKGIEPDQRWISPHGEILRRRYESAMPVSFVRPRPAPSPRATTARCRSPSTQPPWAA